MVESYTFPRAALLEWGRVEHLHGVGGRVE